MFTIRDLPEEDRGLSVNDLWQNGTGWMLQRILPFVAPEVRLHLSAIVIDKFTGARDRISWSGEADGEFSVKSAYAMITRRSDPRPCMATLFNRVWHAMVPERVRAFLWLVAQQVIMTNAERRRRHLCDSGICQVCKLGDETIIHVLRDCSAISGVWRRVVPRRWVQPFFSMSLLEWLFWNLGEDSVIDGCQWSIRFAMIVWWGWKWRCSNVFGSNGKCRDRVKFLNDLAKEVTTANSMAGGTRSGRTRVERHISWKPPEGDWIKLNSDGASRGNPGLATAGGVLRDRHGSWRGGFALNIGICSAPLAELWDVYYGLYIAWEQKITRLEVEVDSEIVVGFLRTGICAQHPLSFLVRLCHGFISRDWIVRISHVYREANRLADGLANYAFSLPLGFHAFDVIPDVVVSIGMDDVRGTSFPRQISV